MKISIYLSAVLAFAFFSCDTFKDISIEKRHYRNGYYVHVRDTKSNETIVANDASEKENQVTQQVIPDEKTASVVEKTTQQKANPKTENGFAESKPVKKTANLFSRQTQSVFHNPLKTAITRAQKTVPVKRTDDEDAVALFLLIILAIILPPLAVILKDGLGLPFLLDLIFWLLGFGFVIFVAGTGYIYLGIFGLIAIIYALFVVLDVV